MYVIESKKILFFSNSFLLKISDENFAGILEEVGINEETCTIIKTLKPRVIIDEKDGKWFFKTETNFKTSELEFTPGIEFEEVSPIGEEVSVTRYLFLLLRFSFIYLFIGDYSI
jgi:hypothetical protein